MQAWRVTVCRYCAIELNGMIVNDDKCMQICMERADWLTRVSEGRRCQTLGIKSVRFQLAVNDFTALSCLFF